MAAFATDLGVTSSTDPAPGDAAPAVTTRAPGLQGFVFALFFIFGGITSLNDVVIPKLKSLFTLSYGEAMLVQSAFFAAYFIVSLPATLLVRRIGYLRGASVGLLIMMAGCLLFVRPPPRHSSPSSSRLCSFSPRASPWCRSSPIR